MSSTYSSNLGTNLMGTGDQSGTWGNTTNFNLGTLMEQAIASYVTQQFSSADITLSIANGADAGGNTTPGTIYTAGTTSTPVSARNMYIECQGTSSGNNLIVPTNSKLYFVYNNISSGGGAITVKTSSGTGVAVPVGQRMALVCNGTNIVPAINYLTGTGVFSSITNSSLTSGRVVYSTTGGLETDSANLTFNGTTLTANTLNLTNALTTAYGGTGLSSYTAGDLPYYASGTALSKLGIGTNGQILTSTGSAPQWSTLSGVAVTTFSAGTTGLTPNTATSGAVTLAGTLVVGNGGTGQTSFTSGYVLYGNGTSGLSSSSNMTFNGTSLTLANDASIHGLTVGQGAGSVSTNTAFGASALAANTTGVANTVIGSEAGLNNTSANELTAVGRLAARNNTTGNYNTAVGSQAGYSTSTGANNTSIGQAALYSNTIASNNTAVGYQAGYYNTNGDNVSVGYQSMYGVSGTSFAGYSTAIGMQALYSVTTGNYNTAVGFQSGYYQTTGSSNTFIGYRAGYNSTGTNNTFIGVLNSSSDSCGGLITSGSKNTIIGGYSGYYGGLDIRTSSNYIVLSDGDGNPREFYQSNGEINDWQNPSTVNYKHKKFFLAFSALTNPTVSLVNCASGGTNNSCQVKVRVMQMAYLGSSGSSCNEHIGLAEIWTNGSSASTFQNTMTTTTVLNNSNVGTLSWTGSGNSYTCQYTCNRASNYDTYVIEVEVFQTNGGGWTITMQ
jgi:hypothetical protein